MKRNEIYQNEMKRNEIYRNETERNKMICTQKLEGNAIWRNEYTETEQNRICRNIHACSKPDLDDHWSYKWLFLSEELWVVLFVDVHVIVGEHCLIFFLFNFNTKRRE